MKLKNILTGWVTTLLGMVIMVVSVLDFFGWLQIPAPEGLSKINQLVFGFLVGLSLFLVKPGFIEQKLIDAINSLKKDKEKK